MEKSPKDTVQPDNVTPIARGYRIRFEKIRANVGKLTEQQVDSYCRLVEAREDMEDLLDAEMKLPEKERDPEYLSRLRDGLAEIDEGVVALEMFFKKAEAVKDEFARRAEVMAGAEEALKSAMKSVEEIKTESREEAEGEK